MTAEEFGHLAETYGGTLARWPVEVREAGLAFCVSEPQVAQHLLGQAELLDAALDSWTSMSVSHTLREDVIALASNGPARSEGRSWLWRAGFGAGLAAACAAGLVLGVTVTGPLSGVTTSDEPVSAVMAGYELPASSSTAGTST